MTSLRLQEQPLDYHLISVGPEKHAFLRKLFDAFGFRTLRVWVDGGVSAESFDRQGCEGLVTALGECDGRTIAIAWSDFRVKASSYGRANSRRFTAFLRELREFPNAVPLIYVVNSAGLSLMEGRSAFCDAFALWPELLRHAEERLLLTCAVGKCLGLAPLLFGLGHYRVAVARTTHINLTGPEVIRLFFGTGVDFEARAAAERCLECNDLVHEVVPSLDDAFRAVEQHDAGGLRGIHTWRRAADQAPGVRACGRRAARRHDCPNDCRAGVAAARREMELVAGRPDQLTSGGEAWEAWDRAARRPGRAHTRAASHSARTAVAARRGSCRHGRRRWVGRAAGHRRHRAAARCTCPWRRCRAARRGRSEQCLGAARSHRERAGP